MGKFTIKIENHRDPANLYLLLTATSQTGFDGGAMEVNKPIKAADFFSGGDSISADVLDGGRLYVGYGPMHKDPQPDPNSTQYYGWIEFSKKFASDGLWINLSNVDMLGLPLALQGTLADGGPFSLGYNKSVTEIIAEIKAKALTGGAPKAAIRDCDNGSEKIIAPNVQFPAYRSYRPYLDELIGAKAKLTIHTDTPIGAPMKIFSGSFSDSDAAISLSDGSDTFEVMKDQLNTEHLYRCDGGTVVYKGETVPMNRPDDGGRNAPAVYTNSLYRNICIGINEGYFQTAGANDSSKFLDEKPFQSGQGNIYAEIIHNTSNSYGFPYADGNLKSLIESDGEGTVTMVIMKDDESGYYSKG